MVGNPSIPVLTDVILKRFDMDKQTAFKTMHTSVMLDERSLDNLKKYGYTPWSNDSTYETVAKGLEYTSADASVTKVTGLAGAKKDCRYFPKRSQSYKYRFDRKAGFIHDVASGEFRKSFNPFHFFRRNGDYIGGDVWQYTWLVSRDVSGLVKLFDSGQKFVIRLGSLFTVVSGPGADASSDISELVGQYAYDDEPSHHVICMCNYMSRYYKTAKKVREILKTMYHNDFDDLSGNEDAR